MYHSWACPLWLTSVWQFMSRIGLNITMSQAWLPPNPTGNGVNLMKYFISQKFSKKQLQQLNHCL